MDYDSAYVLYSAARDAVPTDLGLFMRFRGVAWYAGRSLEFRREYEALPGSSDPDLACLRILGTAPVYRPSLIGEVRALEQRLGESACSALIAAGTSLEAMQVYTPAEVLATWQRVARYRLRGVDIWAGYSHALIRMQRWSEAEAILRDAIRLHPHPLEKTELLFQLALTIVRRGDTARAGATQRALRAAIDRDGRPGLRKAELSYLIPRSSRASFRAATAELARLARRHSAWVLELSALEQEGAHFIDHGEPAAALEPLDRAATLSDSVGSAFWQAITYTRRGRAYAKLGRLSEAERDLLFAAARAREAREPYYVGEAYHNLAHVHEAQGRYGDASAAADQYISAFGANRLASPAMMSYHDAGMIRWKAGWHAAAHEAFREMVRIIDEQRQNYNWAGEYYERIGDWQRAVEYYQRGLQSRAPEDIRQRPDNLAGVARAFASLGLVDSAESAARAHDALFERWVAWNTPLLPGILARRGRLDEGVAVAATWAARQVRGGNVQGAAIAYLQLAELLHEWGKPPDARRAAQTAESLAVTLNLTDEMINARRIGGVALLNLGQVDSGLTMLRNSATLAESRPTAAGLLSTHVALGDALGKHGRSDQALAAYDRAARVVETMTAQFGLDLDRARFRARHLAPFDGALRTLLTDAESATRNELLVRWSQRRKAMALMLSTGIGSETGRMRLPSPLSIDKLRNRLGRDEALVDYVILDSLIAAIAVTRDQVSVLRLASAPAVISILADRLRRPLMATYVGRLDLARAPYDLAVAEELYERLIEPLLPVLGRRNRLILAPDGVLHHVPFEALVVRRRADRAGRETYASATYVTDGFELTYLPSPQFLQPAAKRDGGGVARSSRLVAITHQAPGGAREAEAISAAWPSGLADLLDGASATEGAVRANVGGRRMLHFATHAQADDRDPLSSHLRLAADAEHDGYLHLTEISQLHIEAPLVVLSACETLRGQLFHGEGMMGLARAFLAGGAGAVVATRWPVGPATADFMAEFYRTLAAGRAPASALHAARELMRRKPETAHPFYWAGFILILGKPT